MENARNVLNDMKALYSFTGGEIYNLSIMAEKLLTIIEEEKPDDIEIYSLIF